MATIERRETKDGRVRWTARVFIGRDDQGKRKFVVRTYDRRKDAEAHARELEGMRDKGIPVTPSKEKLGEYLTSWVESKRVELRPRTAADYRDVLRRYVQDPPDGAPPISQIQLRQLAPEAFEALYRFLREDRGLSIRTITYLHVVLNQALKDAVARKALAANPATLARRPKDNGDHVDENGDDSDIQAMTKEEAARFLEAAADDRYFALWHVLLTGGLRPSEAFALKWDAVDFEDGAVHVRLALSRRGLDREKHPQGWKLFPPKTKKGRRIVTLPPVAMSALRKWKATQAEERLRVGAAYENQDFVFATKSGKPLDGSNIYDRNFRRIMATAELGEWQDAKVGNRVKAVVRRFRPAYSLYALRHTHATLLLLAGEDTKVVSERLGHKSVVITMDLYQHVLPEMSEGSAARMQELFGSGPR